jgi:hypothetical protein
MQIHLKPFTNNRKQLLILKLTGRNLLFSILCSECMGSGGPPPRGMPSMDSKGLSHCARCGAVLASPDSVCERCDRELDAPVVLAAPKLDPTVGRYCCPCCSGRFDSPDRVPYPENGPWYRYQTPTPQCPHCGCWLRDRASNYLPLWIYWGYLFLFGSQGVSGRFMALTVGAICLGVHLFFYTRNRRKEYRYAAMSTP